MKSTYSSQHPAVSPPYAYHAIHADEGVWHDGLDMRHAFCKQFARVTASHDLQDRVTAALQGDMEMRREMAAVSNKINDFIA